MKLKKNAFATIVFLTLSQGFSQTSFDVVVNDDYLKLGKINVYNPPLRQMVLDAKVGVTTDCTTILENDGSIETYNGVSSEKSLKCTLFKGIDGSVHLELEGYYQVSILNYTGVAGNVRIYSDETDLSGVLVIDEHTFTMNQTNPNQSVWLKSKYLKSWPDISSATVSDPSVLLRGITLKVDFIATQTP